MDAVTKLFKEGVLMTNPDGSIGAVVDPKIRAANREEWEKSIKKQQREQEEAQRMGSDKIRANLNER